MKLCLLSALSAPWTDEDGEIAFRRGRGYWATTLRASALQADICDAHMMLMLERTRQLSRQYRPADYPYCMVHCLMRAELQDSGTFNWH